MDGGRRLKCTTRTCDLWSQAGRIRKIDKCELNVSDIQIIYNNLKFAFFIGGLCIEIYKNIINFMNLYEGKKRKKYMLGA